MRWQKLGFSSRKIKRKLQDLLGNLPVVLQEQYIRGIGCELFFNRKMVVPVNCLVQISNDLLCIRRLTRAKSRTKSVRSPAVKPMAIGLVDRTPLFVP